MLPGPVRLHVTPAALEVNAFEPPRGTLAEPGVTVINVGVGVGMGGGVLLPPPHATKPIRTKETRNAETILVIKRSSILRGKIFLKYRPSSCPLEDSNRDSLGYLESYT